MFVTGTSEGEATKGQLQKELSLFGRLVIDAHDLEDERLEWWRINEVVFPNVGFLACQYLAIPGSQIESERIFSVAGILSNIRHSTLNMDNLNSLVMIYKNWPTDARTNVVLYEHLIDFYDSKATILEENENLEYFLWISN